MKKFTNIITIIALILIIVLIGGVVYGYYKKATMEVKNPIVTMEVQDFGTIKLELYPEMAPQTVCAHKKHEEDQNLGQGVFHLFVHMIVLPLAYFFRAAG